MSLEIETALRWGYMPDVSNTIDRNWFLLPREARAALMAHEQIKSLNVQIDQYEREQKRVK